MGVTFTGFDRSLDSLTSTDNYVLEGVLNFTSFIIFSYISFISDYYALSNYQRFDLANLGRRIFGIDI